MSEAIVELFRRQTRAIAQVELRLRALERLVEGGEERFLAAAVADLEAASEQLAALELTRSLVVSAAGLTDHVSAADLIERFATSDASAALMGSIIDQLQAALLSLAETRSRTERAIRCAARTSDYRRAAAEALAVG